MKNSFDVFDMLFSVHEVNDDIVKIYYNAKIESFRQNLVDKIVTIVHDNQYSLNENFKIREKKTYVQMKIEKYV